MWFFAGVQCDRIEDDADVLRQRLVQALVVPTTVAEGGHRNAEPAPPDLEMAWRKPNTDEHHLLDVAQLSLAQRVVVQLNGVGVFTVGGQVCSGEGRAPISYVPAFTGFKSVHCLSLVSMLTSRLLA